MKSLITPHVQTKWIPGGKLGTTATIRDMRKLSKEGQQNAAIQTLALEIVEHQPEREKEVNANAIYEHVKNFVRYEYDPFRFEKNQNPFWFYFLTGQGDCNNLSILISCLAESVGIPTLFKTIKGDSTRPDQFSHIYPMLQIRPGIWVAADRAVEGKELGWEPPPGKDPKRSKVWSI